jgi:hypothetical protein
VVEHYMACRHELYAVCQRGLRKSLYEAAGRAAFADASRHEPVLHR